MHILVYLLSPPEWQQPPQRKQEINPPTIALGQIRIFTCQAATRDKLKYKVQSSLFPILQLSVEQHGISHRIAFQQWPRGLCKPIFLVLTIIDGSIKPTEAVTIQCHLIPHHCFRCKIFSFPNRERILLSNDFNKHSFYCKDPNSTQSIYFQYGSY